MKTEAFPPTASLSGDRANDDRAACRFLVELDRRGKHVDGEHRADPRGSRSDGRQREAAEQQRRDGIGRAWDSDDYGAAERSMPVIATLAYPTTRSLDVGDHPGRGGIAPPVLAGVAAQPLVERGLAAIKSLAVMSPRVEQRRAAQLSQAS